MVMSKEQWQQIEAIKKAMGQKYDFRVVDARDNVAPIAPTDLTPQDKGK